MNLLKGKFMPRDPEKRAPVSTLRATGRHTHHWHVECCIGYRTEPMSPTAPALNTFHKIVNQPPEEHLYPGDRIRILSSPYTRMLGREYEVIQQDEHGTLMCKAYEGAMEFQLYTYQVQLVHRPIRNKMRALFEAFAV